MMMRRPIARSGGLRRSTSGNERRPVEWIRASWGLDALTTGGGVASRPLVSAPDFDDFTRPTVVRIRGSVYLFFGDVSANLDGQVVMGITLVNPGEPAPDPFTQMRGNRWMWWHCAAVRALNPPVAELSGRTIEFDVRSMRKRLVDGSDLLFCITAVGVGPGPDGGYAVGASTLVKE